MVQESVNLREEQVTRAKQVIIRSVKLNHRSGGRANKSPGQLKRARASFTINSFQACHHLEEVWLSKQKAKEQEGDYENIWQHSAARALLCKPRLLTVNMCKAYVGNYGMPLRTVAFLWTLGS